LFGGDGFDNQAARLFWIEWNFGTVKRGVHKGDDFGLVESVGAFEPHVASDITAAQEATARIGNAGALKKTETDMIGIEDDREDGVGRALVGNETDDQGVVVVLDHFEGAGEALAHFA
jgi:hypothetical protein